MGSRFILIYLSPDYKYKIVNISLLLNRLIFLRFRIIMGAQREAEMKTGGKINGKSNEVYADRPVN